MGGNVEFPRDDVVIKEPRELTKIISVPRGCNLVYVSRGSKSPET